MNLHVEITGSGRPLVLIHGLFGSSTNLRGVARIFSDRYQVFNLDLPNHGRSPHTSSMTYQDMSAALSAFATDAGIENAVWLGHSMGGKALMDLMLRVPESRDLAVVVDIAPVSYDHSYQEYVQAMLELDPAALTSRGTADKLLRRVVTDKATRLFLLQNLIPAERGYRWRINLPVLQQHLPDIKGFPDHRSTFKGPALFVAGQNSNYITDTHRPRIRELFPQAKFAEVAAAGHWVHADQPQALVDVVYAFVESSDV